jgi:hypothetical protein
LNKPSPYVLLVKKRLVRAELPVVAVIVVTAASVVSAVSAQSAVSVRVAVVDRSKQWQNYV